MPATLDDILTDEQKQLFAKEGYMILPGIISDDMLQMLREECSYFLGYYDATLDLGGAKSEGISHRGKRYFVSNRYRMSPRLWRFLFSPLMAEIGQAVLGGDLYLFSEQWVVKGAEVGMKFAWHQDSGYVKFHDKDTRHRAYLTCWCTLDDVSEENGTVYLLPHSRGGTSHTIFDHTRQPETNDLVGYTGGDPGIPVVAPAGSVVVFTSFNFHRSGANTTDRMRRIYLAQYSAEPLLTAQGELWGQAVPFVKAGQVVYDRDQDFADPAANEITRNYPRWTL
jgi:hypothetical protein